MRNHWRVHKASDWAAWVALTLLVAPTFLAACNSADPAPVASIQIGTTRSEVNALILVAQDRGYFQRNNVEVIHDIYPSGVSALDGMFAGEVDMATGSEFAFVSRVLDKEEIRAIAVINRSSIEYIVARVDRDIRSIVDLRGKEIGVPIGSRPEFALDRFLLFRGIDRSQVTLVDVPVNQSVEALVSGQVDAVAAWQPYINEIHDRMGAAVITWSAQEDQPSYTLLMGRSDWVADNREPLARFLNALVEAESWVTANPDAAREFIQAEWDYDETYMASVWPDHTYTVLLDQTLIVVMEDQARWLIERDAAGQALMPNFVRFIYFDALESVRPDSVNVIR